MFSYYGIAAAITTIATTSTVFTTVVSIAIAAIAAISTIILGDRYPLGPHTTDPVHGPLVGLGRGTARTGGSSSRPKPNDGVLPYSSRHISEDQPEGGAGAHNSAIDSED